MNITLFFFPFLFPPLIAIFIISAPLKKNNNNKKKQLLQIETFEVYITNGPLTISSTET